jgi:hypothetical protein
MVLILVIMNVHALWTNFSYGFRDCNDLGHLATKMVKTDRHICFSLVYRLVELALILPLATTTVERAFSTMNIIKTERRNKMSDEWMNNSMLSYIERDMFVDIKDEKILKHFQGLRTRKINLPRSINSLTVCIDYCIFRIHID